jgi:hypothetical protein
LLDRLPETELPKADIDFPPLAGPARTEDYGVLRPAPDFPVADDSQQRIA